MSDGFNVTGLEAFEKALLGFAGTVGTDVTNKIKALTLTISYTLILETPQYSGAAASAWRAGIGAPSNVTDKPYFPLKGASGHGYLSGTPYSNRDRNPEAVAEAINQCAGVIASFKLGMGDIYVSNGLDYVHWFEHGMAGDGIPLRTVNVPPRRVALVLSDTVGLA